MTAWREAVPALVVEGDLHLSCEEVWSRVGRNGKNGGGNRAASVEVKAVHKILWCITKNNWFKYPVGLRLLYF